MTADIAKQRYISSYDWMGGSDDNANAATRATEWNKWHGGNGNDIIIDGLGGDTLRGNAGNDFIMGRTGAD